MGTWIFPACLFGWFWSIFTFVPLIALYNVPINPMAVFYILCMACTVSVTSLVFPWKRAFARNDCPNRRVNFNTYSLRRSFYILSISAIVCLAINAINNGFTFSLSIYALLKSSNDFITDRYEGNTIGTIFSKIGLVFMYATAVIGGLISYKEAKKVAYLTIFSLTFLSPILLLVIEGNKGALPQVAAIYFGAVLVNKIKSGEKMLFEKGSLMRALLIFIIVFPLIVFSFLARGLYDETDLSVVIAVLKRSFASYSSAHIYAFSDWYNFRVNGFSTQNYNAEPLTGGFYTFMSLFRLFGDMRPVPPGTYDEYFQYGYFVQTNIYTIFRGLITDFGIPGSFVVGVTFGFLIHLSFFGLLTARNSALQIAFFPHFVGAVYSSIFISALIYNSFYLSMFCVIFVLTASKVARNTASRGQAGV